MIKKALLSLPLVASVLLACLGGRSASQKREDLRSVPILPREQLAVEGIRAGYERLMDALAPVITDSRTRAQIVSFLAPRLSSLEKARDDLQQSIETRVGFAPIASGTDWVPRKEKSP